MGDTETKPAPSEKTSISPKWRISLLLVTLLVAFSLRLTYALEISPGSMNTSP
jgi:hypothetical protein